MPAPGAIRPSARAQDGFALIEVLVSAVMVALIVVATLTGFTAVNRATAEERRHNQAAQLAAESQEKLRSNPASVLSALYGKPRTFTKAYGGTTYIVTQTVEPLNSGGTSAGCSATEKTSQTGANVSIETAVTWTTAGARAKNPTLREHGIITPPVGSALEVDVLNGAEPLEAPVAGVTARVLAAGVTLEGTTGAGGCVVFTGLPATAAKVEIPEKLNYVTPSGALKIPAKELTIAPNITTHYQVIFNEGGQIKAKFMYKGATTGPEGKAVTGETFIVFQNAMNLEPNFEVGAAGEPPFEFESSGERKWKALTGTAHSGATAVTPTAPSYSRGDLFPFSSAWLVTAGDCKKNNVAGTEDEASAVVTAGKTTTVEVPLSYLKLEVMTGTEKAPGSLDKTPHPVTITNTGCEGELTPDNATAANLKHTQETKEGHLERPFQPFGKAKLCLTYPTLPPLGLLYRRMYAEYTLSTAVGETVKIYTGELFKKEVEKFSVGKVEYIAETLPSPATCP